MRERETSIWKYQNEIVLQSLLIHIHVLACITRGPRAIFPVLWLSFAFGDWLRGLSRREVFLRIQTQIQESGKEMWYIEVYMLFCFPVLVSVRVNPAPNVPGITWIKEELAVSVSSLGPSCCANQQFWFHPVNSRAIHPQDPVHYNNKFHIYIAFCPDIPRHFRTLFKLSSASDGWANNNWSTC